MTVVITEETFGTVKKIKFAWESDALGVATGQTVKSFSGELLRLITVPGAGEDKPDNSYDITITDEDSVDALIGAGVDRSDVNTEQVIASNLGAVANTRLTINVAGAGAANKGTAYLYLR